MKKYKLVEIKELSEMDFDGEVYDLHVKDDHSYNVNGNIAVHNSCCQTRENTGVGVPQLSALVNVREALPEEAYIIADGGIKKTGDIAKALKYADAVMMGGFFAGTTETPGHVYETMGGDFYKTMAGSASAESKVRSGNKNSFVEGGIRQVPFRGHVKYILAKAKENIQSSFSYSGAKNMEKFKKKSKLIKISGGGKKESKI